MLHSPEAFTGSAPCTCTHHAWYARPVSNRASMLFSIVSSSVYPWFEEDD